MKIRRLESDCELVRRSKADLRELLSQPSEADLRVCPECTLTCPSCGSTACTCVCSMDCQHIPAQMTSDSRFPIEPAIAPLVYALSSLRVCEPCWSCEGHADAQGKVIRIPRVWFYCRSLTYPRLMDRYFSHLKLKKRLNYPWHLCVTHSDADNADAAFSHRTRSDLCGTAHSGPASEGHPADRRRPGGLHSHRGQGAARRRPEPRLNH